MGLELDTLYGEMSVRLNDSQTNSYEYSIIGGVGEVYVTAEESYKIYVKPNAPYFKKWVKVLVGSNNNQLDVVLDKGIFLDIAFNDPNNLSDGCIFYQVFLFLVILMEVILAILN